MSPSKHDILTQQEPIQTDNDIAFTHSCVNDDNSRLYQLGMLCASPGISKDNLSHEMLSNLDKSNIIKDDQRKIISTIHTDNKSIDNKSSLTAISINNNLENTSQTNNNETSNPSMSSKNSSNVSSTTSSTFEFNKNTKSLKRKRVPPPLDLSDNTLKGYRNNSSGISESANSKRLKYLISTTTSNNNNNNDDSNANDSNKGVYSSEHDRIKSAPPNILHFPYKHINLQPSIINPENYVNSPYERFNPRYVFQPYPPSFEPHFSAIYPFHMPYPYLTNITPSMLYNPFEYYNNPIPYPNNIIPYIDSNRSLYNMCYLNKEEPVKKEANNEISEMTNHNDNNNNDNNAIISGDIRIMNDIFTFEFLNDKKLSKDTFLSICSRVWDESLDLSKKEKNKTKRNE